MQIVQMAFPNGKRKVFTTSYDDGTKQDEKLIALMNQYGIKGTFNLNSGCIGRKARARIDGFDTDISTFEGSEILKIYDGHEIACHALTHMKLTDISTGTVAYQIMEDRKNLEEITGKMVNGFAYPFGSYNKKIIRTLKECNIYYARTVNSTKEFRLPEDFLRWNPTCHHNEPDLMQLIQRFSTGKSLFGEPWMFYLWGHAYEFDQRDNWQVVEEAFKAISNACDNIWMATNEEIYRYIWAFSQLEFTADGKLVYNPTAIEIWMVIDSYIVQVAPGSKIKIEI